MIRRMMVILGFALVFGASVGWGDVTWQMRIHGSEGVEYFPLADIDSLTFVELPAGFVPVPAGAFVMGDGEASCGMDEHEVTLTRDFYLGQHQVTNLEYKEVLQWAYDHGHVGANTSSVWDSLDASTEELLDLDGRTSDGMFETCEIQFDGAGTFYLRPSPRGMIAYPPDYDPSSHPVKEVTWYGSVRYCDWLSLQAGLPRAYEHGGDWSCNGGDPYGAAGYRLPTDAEWEYAAQWDDERIYPWGDEEPDCGRANYYPCVDWTVPVGTYPDAPGALGLSNMAGNVWEWCNDWWVCDLGTTPVTDPPGPGTTSHRVSRGAPWGYYAEGYMRCAYRAHHPVAGNSYLGFRAARTVSAP
ncbi:formylglycine-generating enzyme family protein [Candidatus Eisenbacteria bacterium]|uniref:Formylglycine-generating enzyme family protein n=1 Tax=Eiseniibacteriota bacterium TaxID=2212470 RepID=A0ABV6YL48_UNCEI